jgi:hypothetical protein
MRAVDSSVLKRLIEKAASWSDERSSLSVLLITWSFADEYHFCFATAFAEYCLSSRSPEVASATIQSGSLKFG